jgi:hypothetical protein
MAYLRVQCSFEFLHVSILLRIDVLIGEIHQQSVNTDSVKNNEIVIFISKSDNKFSNTNFIVLLSVYSSVFR